MKITVGTRTEVQDHGVTPWTQIYAGSSVMYQNVVNIFIIGHYINLYTPLIKGIGTLLVVLKFIGISPVSHCFFPLLFSFIFKNDLLPIKSQFVHLLFRKKIYSRTNMYMVIGVFERIHNMYNQAKAKSTELVIYFQAYSYIISTFLKFILFIISTFLNVCFILS